MGTLRVPEHWIADHWRHETKWAADFGLADPGHEVATIIVDSLRLGLEAMNQLSADDPIWKNTNGEPTVYKLPGWADRMLKANPGDELARWVKFATERYSTRNACLAIEPLINRDPSLIRLIVRLAQHVRDWSGANDDLRGTLFSTFERWPGLAERVRALAESPQKEVRETAQIAVDVLNGADLAT